METSPSVEAHVHERIAELQKYHPRIVGCRVVLKASDKRKAHGRDFEVQLTVSIPGPDVYVSRQVGQHNSTDDMNLAIHRAFDAARRLLKKQSEKMDPHQVKQHPILLHGTIDRLFPGEGYGFIKADDGRDVYFEEDNLTEGDWKKVSLDMKVRFRENFGDKGTYATNVALV